MYLSRLGAMVVIFAVLFLGGCLVPDQYQTTIQVKKDKIEFRYKGMLVDSAIVESFHKKNINEEKAKQKTEKVMKDFEKIYKESGITVKVDYVKPGEFSVVMAYRVAIDPGKKHSEFSSIEFQRIGEDKIRIESADTTDAKAMKVFTQFGIQSRGDVVVLVDSGGKVLDQNAQETPGMLSNKYVWHLELGSLPMRFVAQF